MIKESMSLTPQCDKIFPRRRHRDPHIMDTETRQYRFVAKKLTMNILYKQVTGIRRRQGEVKELYNPVYLTISLAL